MVAIQQWFTLMISQWLILLPWLVIGVGLSTVILFFAPRAWWAKTLPRNGWSQILVGTVLGLLVPLGQVGALPVMRRLFLQTGSSGLAIAFWLSAVSLNPFILSKLWQQLPERGGFVLFYGAFSAGILLLVAGIFSFQRQQRRFKVGKEEEASTVPYPAIARPSSARIVSGPTELSGTTNKLTILATSRRFRSLIALQNIVEEFFDWSIWLLFACGLMALGQSFFSIEELLQQGILGLLGMGIFYAVEPGQMAALADLLLGTYSPGIALGFLLTGTFWNGLTLVLLINVVRLHAHLYLSLLLGLTVLAGDLWLNFYVF